MTGEARSARNTGSSAGLSLAGRTAVVTGGSSGIGRAIAQAFAAAGADVVVGYNRNARGAEEVVAAIQALGRRAAAVQADIGRDEDVRRLVREAFGTFGCVDVWVNNAGADILTGEGAKLPMRAKLDLLLAVDLRGTVLCCWEVAERMREQGAGVILNVSWDHALTGMAGPEAQLFAAAKGGIVSFSKSLARSVAPEVRVNVLAPGWIATAFAAQMDGAERRRIAEAAPLRRWGEPDDVAQAALFLASPNAAFLTGIVLPVSGGVVM
ncbi:MAG TPA: SDR family oxidoreductase [Longimicrobiales bacterium]